MTGDAELASSNRPAVAQRLIAFQPEIVNVVRRNRAFLRRAVRFELAIPRPR
ncbi:hypothetical protein ACIQUM_05475 [Amycolatopsis azurea]|uniref:hypothetical protein n=1 Tax=Amycolatopsis azurea TaxID=36819 RepID=UPI0037F9F1FB